MTWNRPVLTALTLSLAACGGGGTTGAINSLQGPEQVSLVESSSGSSSSLRLPRGVRGVEGSAYQTDATRFWVRDASMSVLDQANSILGYLHDTQYWEQTNNGAYRALVASNDGGGGERGNSGPSYEDWVVLSTRASNADPQIVSFWVPGDEENVASTIYGKLTVTVEPTDAQPLGAFALNFKSLPNTEAPTSTATSFEGYIRTVTRTDGQTELEFYMGNGDPDGTVGVGERASRQRAHFVGDMVASTGRAYAELLSKENNGTLHTEQGEYQLQFNADYVARKDVVSTVTNVLDRNDFDTQVHRYGLYNATTEARVNRLGGFCVTDVNGNQGWAGFHGVWFPQNVTLTDGMALTRRSYGNGAATTYTLVKVPGKLQKRTRSSITLADLLDEDLEMFDPTAGGQARVRFTGSDFVRTAERSGNSWTSITPVSITSNYTSGQWLNFWSQGRGSVEFAWPSTLSGAAPAYVWQMTTLTADSAELASGDITLYGYFHQLTSNISNSQANFIGGDTPYVADATSVTTGNQTYTFDKETLMLLLGSDPVNFANGVTATSGPGMHGLNCGPLFPAALSSFNDMQTQTTTYDWSIGSNSWNQLLALKDSNNAYVSFDAPLRFTYVHDESGSPFHGRTFFLEWDGSNLHGIPHEQDPNTGYYRPSFNIPTGTTLTDGTTTYKIKQLEGEQRMVAVGDPATVFTAQGFDLSTSLTAPTAAPFTDPAIGAKPTVTTPPLYVGGVLQSDS